MVRVGLISVAVTSSTVVCSIGRVTTWIGSSIAVSVLGLGIAVLLGCGDRHTNLWSIDHRYKFDWLV